MSAPVFVLDRALLAQDRVVLDGAEGRHAATVRRLAPGEHVVLTDGHGLRADITHRGPQPADELVGDTGE